MVCATNIQRVFGFVRCSGSFGQSMVDSVRSSWVGLGHLVGMDRDQLSELGLERMLTTSELADYLGVKVQAIYDLRADGRGPAGIPIGRELRYPISDIRRWLDGLHEPTTHTVGVGGEI